MGDGILNMANLGWVIVFAIMYVGATKASELPPEVATKIQDSLHKVRHLPIPGLVALAWLALRFTFALGWQLQLEMLFVLAAVNYTVRQTSRAKTEFVNQFHQRLSESKDPTALLGRNLPEWVTFPSANRVQWLNTMIGGMWPSIAGATDTTMRAILEPLLEQYRPSFVYGFKIKSASIGTHPLVVNGIQHHVYGTSETTLDISVSWDADMDIRLLVRVPGPDVEVLITDFEMRMTVRAVLGPHVPVWPCFANMAVSLVGTPDLDFNVRAAKISLDAVPGLGTFLDSFIRQTLVGLLAYPKGFSIPIVKGYVPTQRGLAKGALGTLKVKLLHVDNFLSKFSKYKKTPFYAKIAYSEQNTKRLRSASYTGFDSEMKDTFSFTLYDTTGTITLWVYFDVVGSDVLVGQATIPTKQLIDSDLQEDEVILVKPSDPSHTRRVSLFVKGDFLRFEGRRDSAEATTPRSSRSNPPEGLPPRLPSATYRSKVDTTRQAPPVPQSRSQPNTPRSVSNMGGMNSGSLFVKVISAANLKNVEVLSKSDPYVFLRIGSSTAKSKHVDNNLNPTFNFEAELNVSDWETDQLVVSLIDYNDVSKHKALGSVSIPVVSVASSKDDTLSGTFKLDTQGTVTLSLSLLRHS